MEKNWYMDLVSCSHLVYSEAYLCVSIAPQGLKRNVNTSWSWNLTCTCIAIYLNKGCVSLKQLFEAAQIQLHLGQI